MHWVRLVHFHVNKAHALKAKNVQFWSPVNSPFETCFLEVKARHIIICNSGESIAHAQFTVLILFDFPSFLLTSD